MANTIATIDIGSATVRLLKAVRRTVEKRLVRSVVTLDVDNTTVRLLETRGGRVRKWVSATVEPDSVEGEVASDWRALGTTVKRLMKLNDIKSGKVTASLSGLYSISRIVRLSDLPPAPTTEEAVLQMAEEILPLSMDNVYLSWQTTTIGDGEQQVFVLGVPRHFIDDEVRGLRAVGVNPHILELKGMALARTVNKMTALVLNIGLASFDIVIAVSGVPVIMRTILWQQGDLTVEDRVEQLTTTLELTVDFYNLKYPHLPLEPTTPLFITGQMSQDSIMMDKVQARLGYPVEPLAPPLEYPAELPVSQYAVNIGLALKGMASSENPEQSDYLPLDINLLPRVYRGWRPSVKQLFSFVLVIAAIALLFPLFQVTNEAMNDTTDLQGRFDVLNNDMQRRQIEIKGRTPWQQAINEYNTILDMGGNFIEDIGVISSQAREAGVQVLSVHHAVDSITINWQSDSYAAIENYLAALEETGRFSTPIPRPETGWPFITGGITKLQPRTGK